MYDLVVIGLGVAGMTAALYAKRYGLNVLVIGELVGGMGALADRVDNWPGEPSIEGVKLMEKMFNHLKSLDVNIEKDRVEEIEKKDGVFRVKTSLGKDFETKTLILAMGSEKRKLNAKNEEKFMNKGVSYCFHCDAYFFKNKTVAVLGGGNSAVSAALALSDIANHVYVIYRRDKFEKAAPSLVDKMNKTKNIEKILNKTILEFRGDEILKEVVLSDNTVLEVDGVFVEIGIIPNTELAKKLEIKIENNLIKVDGNQKTSLEGVAAAGDLTTQFPFFRQFITASAQGAIAAHSVFNYLKTNKW